MDFEIGYNIKKKIGKAGYTLVAAGDLFGVTGKKSKDGADLTLIPQNNWLPFLSFKIVLFPDRTLKMLELKILGKNPFASKEKNIYDENDRMTMVVKREEGIAETMRQASKFLNAKSFYPAGIIARFHNDEGELKIGCNAFADESDIYPDIAVYGHIASIISSYLNSKEGRALSMDPRLPAAITETAELIGFHAGIKQMGIIEPGIEYGWDWKQKSELAEFFEKGLTLPSVKKK